MSRYALMGVATSQQRTAERAAQRESREMICKADAIDFGSRQRRCTRIRIAVLAESLGPKLISKNPDHVRTGRQWRVRDMMPRRFPSILGTQPCDGRTLLIGRCNRSSRSERRYLEKRTSIHNCFRIPSLDVSLGLE